jgi:tRNA threonylcarbamoyl adenosine modification protein YeaZ
MTDSLILGLDTAAGIAVGVARNGVVVARRRLDDSRRHVESLVPLIQEALAEAGATTADLTGLVVGMGPGPFTGLRVGIVAAHTLAAVHHLPVRHVCSLDTVALAAAPQPTDFVAALDARRKEVYWARYDAAGRRTAGPFVTPPAAVPALPVVGPGAALIPDPAAGTEPTTLDAGLLAARAADLPEVGPEPLYLRRPDAAVSTTTKSVLAAGEKTGDKAGEKRP